ncbi:MAG: hypothetical protein LKJ86_08050 [Oscillibacter sp.]|nr:hypothetical protein [Oscillibacter sp.]
MKSASTKLHTIKDLIENSEIFGLSKDVDPVRFRNLKYEFVEYLYEYAQTLSNTRYRDTGLEIVETATMCLQSYDRNRGPFTHYFASSLAKRVKKEDAVRNETETRGGIALPEEVQRQISQIKAIAGKMMRDADDEIVVTSASEYLKIPISRVRELLKLNEQFVVARAELDSNTCGIDNISDEFILEDHFLDANKVDEIFNAIDNCFCQCRKSQQVVISKLLTLRLLSCSPDILQKAINRMFFDHTIIDLYSKTGKIPTARDISVILNKNESSTSRTLSQFSEKVSIYLTKIDGKE